MLSANAEKLINDYLNLPFKGVGGVRCPYFNNARQRQRGQLRVLVGKGTPQEIIEEAHIISIQYHAGLFEKSGECCLHHQHTGEPVTGEDIRKFLIDNDIGIECSGFVTQILRTHYADTRGIDIAKKMVRNMRKNFIRKIIANLRPVENIGVINYTDNNNTAVVAKADSTNYADIKAGDVITMLETGPRHTRNHILLVTDTDGKTIWYAHARAWSSEGKYGHGVARGSITITKPAEGLLAQTWREKDVEGGQNETYVEAQNAKTLEVRRLVV